MDVERPKEVGSAFQVPVIWHTNKDREKSEGRRCGASQTGATQRGSWLFLVRVLTPGRQGGAVSKMQKSESAF